MSSLGRDFALEKVSFEQLPGWQTDDPSSLLPAMQSIRSHLRQSKPYRTGALGLSAEDLSALLEKADEASFENASTARRFFESHCVPFKISPSQGKSGFVTAFYEPELDVSEKPDATFKYPIYRRPPDLIDLDDANRPSDIDPYYAFGLQRDGEISTYPDRGEIDRGYLEGRGLEIAWAKSKVDLFFVHVQGAARLRYADGTIRRITYAAKAGHPFSPVGRLLLDRGELDPATISMQTIRQWLNDHPEEVDEVLWHNRSYIFFREADVEGLELGPIAAAKVPLIAGRALAVDRLIHTFGFPFYISSQSLTHLDKGRPFGRLMLALDTGSAIVGPARGDIFTGSGDEAGELAGTVRNAADFYILIPRRAAERYR
ncbi:murein transglycosylase A [Agrobacterium rubi]|uniref:peptidoglycan lytic exotransglycosylase n=1 Tax=Agrobacterium rubi TaxID=28099 RepID=A0AAE7R4U1_9HYPH|nr:murein transglycosylase A [Agrobacterium rubi]NTE87549.1 murein transglycosylase A [Agrobacterium rubi]NTF03403.1 murein transglycosylase A [Agrobacterium rubi]NTF37563.1 murein transglycosylase A [Agrobacterium rubi]OCJ45738.1 transglycosylase [Agrobacterium rubi]QTG00268.1 murein transglycosylase A [Agrobacterium rubi]